jgi:hypothetical protein
MSAPSTERLYEAAQQHFLWWLEDQGISWPAEHSTIARYLRTVLRRRGASAVPVHAAALARLYRDQGQLFDIKAPVIQRVLLQARDLQQARPR